MRHFRFWATIITVLALSGFMKSQPVLAAFPASPELSMGQSQEIQRLEGTFQLAVMGGSAVPMDIPQVKSPQEVQPEKPAVEKPKVILKKETKKASKPKKKKVKIAQGKKPLAKKPVTEEDGFLTKTFKKLVGDDDGKKEAAPKTKSKNTDVKKSDKEEEGLLTKTLKSLVGGDPKKEKSAKKKTVNPINIAPTGSSAQKKVEEKPKTAKSETKATLKDSFEKLIGVGVVKDDKGDSQSAKVDTPAGNTKSAKKEKSDGLLGGILKGSDKKKDASATKQVKVDETIKKPSAPDKPKKLTARKYVEEEEGEEGEAGLKKNYGGAKKGTNVLKESFKTLVTDDKKKVEEE